MAEPPMAEPPMTGPTAAAPTPRTLDELAEVVANGRVFRDGSVRVSAITHDSRRAGPGTLFCCVPGAVSDGHDHAPAAVEAGAAALVVERILPLDVPQLLVADARRAMGPLAAELWGRPSEHLDVVGVTGTSGKTTVTHLLAAVLESAGRTPALLGTLSGARTTPEATDLQETLARFRAGGHDSVAMEVSSHALSLHRVDATRFRVAVFTNLGRDHLDFHGTVESYFAAKAELFRPERADAAVLCLDDPRGRLLAATVDLEVHGYRLGDADDIRTDASGSTFLWRGERVRLGLLGRHNVLNALAAATTASVLGLADDEIARGLDAAPAVPGRFEPVDAGQDFVVIVDYSHKPEALEHAIDAARDLTAGAVHLVFGCGGDRDRTKRAPMGEIASRLADTVVITSDNPRSEDPAAIAADIRSGAKPRPGVTVELDRRRAISQAVAAAEAGDVVLIAGKGHEATQTIGDRVLPFDDRVVAAEELAERGSGADA
ncbi:MAG: UDP-N-acetylmuramoyl-L-alanyl-D-glutamate--2,6-diaminopimelate ligase [Actinomycetota bacterium]|nr:UDP-N-acetylmuramoyl-L-alanyl-D-glutamate--2,6-diaminopimelate ligase [Actinomycetota bacterium]